MINEFITEPITATFHIGSEVVLTPSWHEKNVILPNNKLFYILDGEIIIKTERETLIGKKGDMMLIPAGLKHDFYLSKLSYAKKCWLHFDLFAGGTSFLDRYTFPLKIKVGENLPSSREISKTLGSAPNTTRLALEYLASTGIITAMGNRGNKANWVLKEVPVLQKQVKSVKFQAKLDSMYGSLSKSHKKI